MLENESTDEAGAVEPGPRDAAVEHQSRDGHALERSGHQEPPSDEEYERSVASEPEVRRRRPNVEKEEVRS